MPEQVDRVIRGIQRGAGVDKGRAIAIAKSQGLIKQKGKHLATGRRTKKRK